MIALDYEGDGINRIGQSSAYAVCSQFCHPEYYDESDTQYINSRAGLWDQDFENGIFTSMRDVLEWMQEYEK